MKKINVESAIGETICHDITAILSDGTKGPIFKRGHIVTQEDIKTLLSIGKAHLFVWEADADEVHEEDAALAISKAMCGDNVSYSKPSEGKCTVKAEAKGLFKINSKALLDINKVQDFTIVTRAGNFPVEKGDKLAGARIVPLVTKAENVDHAVAIATENAPVFSVIPYLPLKVGIVITGSEVYQGIRKDRFEPVLRQKIKYFNGEVIGVEKCPDDDDVILQAILKYKDMGADLILCTGGMSVDPDDLTPTAIRRSGGEIITQGVPIQPGNMFTIAYDNDITILGIPSAAIHSQITSLDIFLPRIFAGEKLTAEEFAEFGEGGLCLNCPTCHFPNCGFGRK